MIHLPATSPLLIPSLSNSSHHSFDDPLSPIQRSLSPVGRSEDLSFDMAIVEDITGKTTLEKVSAIKTTALESSAFPQAEDLNALFLERQVSNGAELPSTPKVGSLARSALDSNETTAEMEETIPTSSVPQSDSSSEPNTSCVDTDKIKAMVPGKADAQQVKAALTKARIPKNRITFQSTKRVAQKRSDPQENDKFFDTKINELIALKHDSNPLQKVSKSISPSHRNCKRTSFRSLYRAVVDCLAWETENNAIADMDTIKAISQERVPSKRIETALKKARIPENRVAFQPTKRRVKTTQKKSEVMESVASSKADLNALFLERQVSNGAGLPSIPTFTLVDEETIPTSSAPPLDSSSASDTPSVVGEKKSKKRKNRDEDEVDPDFVSDNRSENRIGRKKQGRDELFSQKIDELISLTLEHDPTPYKTVADGISGAAKNTDREHFRRLYQAVVDCLAWETENNMKVDTDKIKEISKKWVCVDRVERTLTKARIPENRVAFKPRPKKNSTTAKTAGKSRSRKQPLAR